MAFENLADKLSGVFKKLRSKGRLSETDVKEAMREIRMALLEADVNFRVAKDFVSRVTEKAIGADILESLSPAQQVIKIVNEELTSLMGGSQTGQYTYRRLYDVVQRHHLPRLTDASLKDTHLRLLVQQPYRQRYANLRIVATGRTHYLLRRQQ